MLAPRTQKIHRLERRWQMLFDAKGNRIPRYVLEGLGRSPQLHRLERRWQMLFDAQGNRIPRYALEGLGADNELDRKFEQLARRVDRRYRVVSKRLQTDPAARRRMAKAVARAAVGFKRSVAAGEVALGGFWDYANPLNAVRFVVDAGQMVVGKITGDADAVQDALVGQPAGTTEQDRKRLAFYEAEFKKRAATAETAAQRAAAEQKLAEVKQSQEQIHKPTKEFVDEAKKRLGPLGDLAGMLVKIVKYAPYAMVGVAGLWVYGKVT